MSFEGRIFLWLALGRLHSFLSMKVMWLIDVFMHTLLRLASFTKSQKDEFEMWTRGRLFSLIN